MGSVGAVANAFLLVYAALFPIINPIANAPLYLGLTEFCTDVQRISLARRVALNSFCLLVGSMFIGSHVLEFFGISLPVVRIGGGLVVSAFGWKLLNAEPTHDASKAQAAATATVPDPFYPLTMPLTVGPGSISVAITLGSQASKDSRLGAVSVGGGWRNCRRPRHRADCVFLLPLRTTSRAAAGTAWHSGCRAAVGFHTLVHRHPNIMEWLE